jgi:hypothetical protein
VHTTLITLLALITLQGVALQKQERQGARPLPWKSTAVMNAPRASHSATSLPDGRVLIAGGFDQSDDDRGQMYLRSAEIYDPRTNKFTSTGEMTYSRAGHTATLLQNGTVLVAGGFGAMGALSSAELFDPATESFTQITSMKVRRGGGTATLLLDGRVLFCGGGDREPTITAELFDPRTKSFALTANMAYQRTAHTATRLPGGMVLVVGGSSHQNSVLGSVEMYDPARGIFLQAATLNVPRYHHAAAAMNDGSVLVIGGADQRDWRGQLAAVERYTLSTGRFVPVSDLQHARFKHADAVIGFEDGTFLIAGGNAAVELYSPAAGISKVVATLESPHYYATATFLPDGSVLIAGGYDEALKATNKAWIWRK